MLFPERLNDETEKATIEAKIEPTDNEMPSESRYPKRERRPPIRLGDYITDGMTDFFNIGQGVRQGCIIMRKALDGFKGSIKVGERTVSNLSLRYADDIVLIAGSMQELEDLVTRVKVASEQA